MKQNKKVRDKVNWTLRLIEDLPQVKTPKNEIARAIKIKKEYYEEKKQLKKPRSIY